LPLPSSGMLSSSSWKARASCIAQGSSPVPGNSQGRLGPPPRRAMALLFAALRQTVVLSLFTRMSCVYGPALELACVTPVTAEYLQALPSGLARRDEILIKTF
jgi:hypothetical protein